MIQVKLKLNNVFYFILGGFILFGILGIFALPIASAIPPTPAFKMINTTSGNVTSHNYADSLLFEGIGITITSDYNLHKITFTSTGDGSPNEIYCSAGEFLISYNATTKDFDCLAGGGGEVNTASSSGVGESLVLAKSGVDLPFKGIAVSGDLEISSNDTDVTISFTETGIGSVSLDDLTDVIITSPAYLSTLFYNGANWIDKIFSINSFDVNCSDTQQLNRLQIDNQTGIVTGTCETDETGSGGTPRGGYLMAHWTQSQTKTNIGTSFVNVYPQTNSNGKAILIDTDAFTIARLYVQWNKIGTGTQTCQIINGATVLVSTNVINGANDSGFDLIPAGLLNAENPFRIQCKSTTSTDDPIFESASIWMK